MAKLIATDIISGFHLLGAINFYLKNPQIAEIEIHLIPNMQGKYLLKEGEIQSKNRSIKIIHTQNEKGITIKKFLEFTCKRLIKTTPTTPEIFLGHHTYLKPSILLKANTTPSKIFIFTFEEGIGSHGGLLHHLRSSRRERKKFAVIKYILRKTLRAKLWVNEHSSLLTYKNLPHTDLINATSELSKLQWKNGETIFPAHSKTPDNSAIFFSSPLIELGHTSESEYIETFSKIALYFKKKGLRLFIKPHPLERTSNLLFNLGLEIIHESSPAEILISRLKPNIVAGFNSGALISANLILGQKSLSLINALPKNIQKHVEPDKSLALLFYKSVKKVDI
jgi:hypothetical protein